MTQDDDDGAENKAVILFSAHWKFIDLDKWTQEPRKDLWLCTFNADYDMEVLITFLENWYSLLSFLRNLKALYWMPCPALNVRTTRTLQDCMTTHVQAPEQNGDVSLLWPACWMQQTCALVILAVRALLPSPTSQSQKVGDVPECTKYIWLYLVYRSVQSIFTNVQKYTKYL